MHLAVVFLLVSVLVSTTTAARSAIRSRGTVLVFAAASLQTALDELIPVMRAIAGLEVKASYAASSTLARQIEQGAPADVFVSADLDWMDYLDQRRLIRSDSRVNLLGNELVLIGQAGRPASLTIAPGFALAGALGSDRLAVADPASVPAGKYARDALTSLGVWDAVAGRLAAADNVRGALLLVSRGEAPLGIVYRTDALADRGIAIVGTFPTASHAPIVYPMALTATAQPDASRVLTFLRSSAAHVVFERLGFRVLP